jgi:hypothetical protein
MASRQGSVVANPDCRSRASMRSNVRRSRSATITTSEAIVTSPRSTARWLVLFRNDPYAPLNSSLIAAAAS